ncbi:MAG TPA: aminotransferase class V-fold PLP-dependent enzyme, partial [Chthoniobacterales bacterium]
MTRLDALTGDENTRLAEFPICRRNIYCAHASDAPLPRRVADAMRRSIERASCDARQYEEELVSIEETRERVAQFLGAESQEIAFTGPTSSGLNIVANGLDWNGGDEVVCYLDDYPANVYPWL